MSFEIMSYSYDTSRKLNRMNKITCNAGQNQNNVMFTPVPYNLDINLYVLTKTQEDGLQVLEQILPVFTPEYTLSINAVSEMNLVQDIPIILNGVDVSDEYDGDFETRRFVTHTLSFTLKLNLYGSVSTAGIIDRALVNTTYANLDMNGNPTTGITIHTWEEDLSG